MTTFTHTFPFDFHGQQVEATVEYTVEPGRAQTWGSPAEGPTLRNVNCKILRLPDGVDVGDALNAAETMAQALWDDGKLPTEPEDTRTGVDD